MGGGGGVPVCVCGGGGGGGEGGSKGMEEGSYIYLGHLRKRRIFINLFIFRGFLDTLFLLQISQVYIV